jgi:Protein of unknwon function (DUF3310)
METFNPTENQLKYGAKDGDLISQLFEISQTAGIIFCVGNAMKYYKRYHSNSQKANNHTDLQKISDYLDRARQGSTNEKYIYAINEISFIIAMDLNGFDEHCKRLITKLK